MTSTSSSQSADRREQLLQQMLDAQSSGQGDRLSLLRSQWVHRYGVDDLPDLAAPAEPRTSKVGSLSRFTALLKESLLEVSSTIHDDPSTPPAQRSAEPPAPPLNTPPSLRRWLVRDGDDVSKAS